MSTLPRIWSMQTLQVALFVQVSTADGFTVEAPNVVLATNSPIHHNVLVHSRQKPWK